MSGMHIYLMNLAQRMANIEARASLPDGSIHWFNTHGFPRYDQHGKIVELIGTLQDITDCKQAEF